LTAAEEDIKAHGQCLAWSGQRFINEYKVQEAVTSVLDFVDVLNKYVEAQAPGN
jgi:methionyl-tRNA synthetase